MASYVGIDLHRRRAVIVVLDEAGDRVWSSRIENSRLNLEVELRSIVEAVEADVTTPRLVLNGAGIRKKFFVSVYVAALYLPERQTDSNALLAASPANRVTMHFVHSRVDKRKLDEGWRDGFSNNLRPDKFAPLADRLEGFIALFGDMHEGDTVVLDYRPGSGTSVTINGELRGSF